MSPAKSRSAISPMETLGVDQEQGIPAIVAGLRAAFDSGMTQPLPWRRRQLRALGQMLTEREQQFSAALAEDLGKPAAESALTELRIVAAEARLLRRRLARWLRPRRVATPLALWPARARITRQPLGTVLVIGPWNYPVQLTLVPLAGALAAGNTVLIKPSELAPATSAALARWLPEYLDPRAVQVVEGDAEVATELLAERYDHIFYTGGSAVARIVAAAAAKHLTPITLELGGKSPAWVDGTVDLDTVADRLSWGKLINTGQTCVAPDYVLTTGEVADRLIPALQAAITRRYGEDASASADYGRILDVKKFDRLESLLEGPDIAFGGQRDRRRLFFAPTVLDNVSLDHPVMQEEIFGPILPIVRVADAATAVELVRQRDKPLALYLFSKDRTVHEAFLAGTSSGGVGVNVPVAHLAAPGLPFGGVGESGMGSYHGEHSIRAFSHERAVLAKGLWPDTLRFVYAPYGRMARFVAKRLM